MLQQAASITCGTCTYSYSRFARGVQWAIVWTNQTRFYFWLQDGMTLHCNTNLLLRLMITFYTIFQDYSGIFLLFQVMTACNINIYQHVHIVRKAFLYRLILILTNKYNARLRLWPTLFPGPGCDWGPQSGHKSDIPLRTGNIWLASVLAWRPCLPHHDTMYFSVTRGQMREKIYLTTDKF